MTSEDIKHQLIIIIWMDCLQTSTDTSLKAGNCRIDSSARIYDLCNTQYLIPPPKSKLKTRLFSSEYRFVVSLLSTNLSQVTHYFSLCVHICMCRCVCVCWRLEGGWGGGGGGGYVWNDVSTCDCVCVCKSPNVTKCACMHLHDFVNTPGSYQMGHHLQDGAPQTMYCHILLSEFVYGSCPCLLQCTFKHVPIH